MNGAAITGIAKHGYIALHLTEAEKIPFLTGLADEISIEIHVLIVN
jgi:hypothetical protein